MLKHSDFLYPLSSNKLKATCFERSNEILPKKFHYVRKSREFPRQKKRKTTSAIKVNQRYWICGGDMLQTKDTDLVCCKISQCFLVHNFANR